MNVNVTEVSGEITCLFRTKMWATINEFSETSENGIGDPTLLKENANKLGIGVYNELKILEEIKNEIKKGNTVLVALDYSLGMKGNHFMLLIDSTKKGWD